MLVQDQAETIAFLRTALASPAEPLETITTHGSMIFLSGDRAFKLKRAVSFPYLDFSTPEKRLASCGDELALNSRTAPAHYLAVRRITREGDGSLTFDGGGQLVDAVVEMRRFPADALFDDLARRGELTPALMDRLARRIAEFHASAAPDTARGGADAIAGVIGINEQAFAESGLVDPQEASRFALACREHLERNRALLDARARAGKVRRCHGDLILRNIFLFEGEPTLFDCIDFNADLATIDILYDLAFLLMDLTHRGHRDFANRVFNRYLDASGEDDGASLLPFFMALRAAVRAHVGATLAAELSPTEAEPALQEARDYLDLAKTLLVTRPARLVAIGGLSGTGKSTVAACLAGHVGNPPGARLLNSDRLRKAAFGVEPGAHLPPEAYAREVSDEIYARMRARALALLKARVPVVADAVFDRPDEREAIAAVAAETQAPFLGIWLTAPASLLSHRVEERSRMRRTTPEANPSDADIAVLEAQIARDPGRITWQLVDAARTPEEIRDGILPWLAASPE